MLIQSWPFSMSCQQTVITFNEASKIKPLCYPCVCIAAIHYCNPYLLPTYILIYYVWGFND